MSKAGSKEELSSSVGFAVSFSSERIKLDDLTLVRKRGEHGLAFLDSKTLAQLQQAEQQRISLRQKSRNGPYIDFLIRKSAKARAAADQDADEFIDEVITDGQDVEEETGVLPEGVSVIHREELVGVLTITIQAFWKDLAFWSNDNVDADKAGQFKRPAMDVLKFARDALCLNAEVTNWTMRRKLLHSDHALEECELETTEERKKRLIGFWDKFHASANKKEGFADASKKGGHSLGEGVSVGSRTPHLLQTYPEVQLCTSKNFNSKAHRGAFSVEVDSHAPTNLQALKSGPTSVSLPDLSKPSRPVRATAKLFPPLCGPDPWKRRGPHGAHMFSIGKESREDKATTQFSAAKVFQATNGFKVKSGFNDTLRTMGSDCHNAGAVAAICTSSKWRSGGGVGNKWRNGGGTGGAVSLPDLHGTSRQKDKKTAIGEFYNTNQDQEMMDRQNSSIANFSSLKWRDKKDLPATDKPDLLPRRMTILPPIRKEHKSPWDSSTPSKSNAVSPTQEYFNACEELGIVPILMPFVTGHSTKLRASGQAMGDYDLLPVVAMISSMNQVDEVDLEDNVMLTDKSLIPLLSKLFGKPASQTLSKLSLHGCLRKAKGLGIPKTVEVIVRLLTEDNGIKYLQKLDLGGINMGMLSHVPLCQAIRHHAHLTEVRLADTNLGGAVANQCVDELMMNGNLQTLDLGWNCFTSDIFVNLGRRVCQSKKLRTLRVANCSAAFKHGGDNPVQFLLEQLARDESLTKLDISMNRVDFRGALVMEDALNKNRTLTQLDVSHNPLGVLGLRSAFRLLSQDSSVLMHFTAKDCSSSLETSAASGIQQFNLTNPGGRYVLRLHRPYHRALLQMFYRTSERFSLSPEVSMTNLHFSNGKFQHAQKDNAGIWVVPTDGTLTVTFNIEPAMEKSLKDVQPYDFETFLQRQLSMMKLRPGSRKIIPMLAEWKNVDGNMKDQIVHLEALSKDFQFTYPQMRQICADGRYAVNEILFKLLPCLPGAPDRYLSSHLLETPMCYLKMLRHHKMFFAFNVQNPTGHYLFDLSNPGDHFVASAILLLDRWESLQSQKLSHFDTSQRGNWSRIRNETYDDASLSHLVSIAEWKIPERGELRLDYSSGKRPPKDATVLDEGTLNDFLLSLERTDAPAASQLEALRSVSHTIWLKSRDLREMLGIYRSEKFRADLYVMMITKVVDMHDEKLFRARFATRESLHRLRQRLGHLTYFPWVQAEQTFFSLDYSQYDERKAANALLQLTAKENWSNIKEVKFVWADGTEDPLPLGIPRMWEFWEKMPMTGKFSGVYICSPEDRNYKLRATFQEAYSLWTAPEMDSDVTWWASLIETPEDVIEYLEFLVSRFPNMHKAFCKVDHMHNGKISMRDFEDSISTMKCKKFKKPPAEEHERVSKIFRFLDPSGEGTISEEEWGILDLVDREIRLSIKEFVKFLSRAFGESLDEAWEAFDEDGGGEIEYEEWQHKLTEVGFFGPGKPIFSFLDKDEEGTISRDEFQALVEFQPKANSERMRSSMLPFQKDTKRKTQKRG